MHGEELHEGDLLIHTMFKLCVFVKKTFDFEKVIHRSYIKL